VEALGGALSKAGILQSGKKIIKKETLEFLNKRFGSHDWNKAMHRLKKYYGIPNDYHGKIDKDGNYLTKKGRIIDSLLSFVY